MSWKEEFEKLCREDIKGEVIEKYDVISCVVETDNIARLEWYLDELRDFIRRHREEIKKPVEISFENKLLGGWREGCSVTYNPRERRFSFYTKVYSEHGEEPIFVEKVKPETIEKEEKLLLMRGVEVKVQAEGEVDQNPATDEFVGVGEAWSSVPEEAAFATVKNLEKTFDLTFKLASKAEEEAKEELIEYIE